MPSIPILHWLKQSDESTRYDGFRLEADEALSRRLARDLRPLRLEPLAPHLLSLDLDNTADLKPGGFRLRVAAEGVSITGPDTAGVHQGLAALKQLLCSGGGRMRHGEATLSPSFAHRGVMLDVSRGKMASLEYLKHLASYLSDLGYNILQLYSEDKLALKKHPLVGSITGAYSEQQIRELDAWCRDLFIELQPCIQTFSHLHGLLCLPGYCRLSENRELFSLAAGKSDVYEFLDDELGETLPWFTSRTLNINMDEAYDIGTGFSREETAREGKGGVFLAHIRRVADIAHRHGAKTLVMWGDFAAKYRDLLPQLPDNVVVVDWNYNPQENYPSLDALAGLTLPFWAAGGVSTWNSLFPRVRNAYVNLIHLSVQAHQKGATGFLNTDWGDYGHMQPLGLSLYGYMIGGQQAFNACDMAPENLEQETFPLIFHDERVERAFCLLMDSNLAPRLQNGFKTMTIYAFFDDLLDGLSLRGNDLYPSLSEDTFRVLRETGGEALRLLNEVMEEGKDRLFFPDEHWAALFGDAFLRELRLAAWATDYTGRKGQLSFDILSHLRSGAASEDGLLILINRIKALYTEFIAIRRAFEQVWRLRAYEQGIEGSLSLFDKAGVQLGEAVKWLAQQRTQLITTDTVDAGLESYEAGKAYRILWTSDFKNLWDRAYPWQ